MIVKAQQTRTSGNMTHTVSVEIDSDEIKTDVHEYIVKVLDAHFASVGIMWKADGYGAGDTSSIQEFKGGVLRAATLKGGKRIAKWHGGKYEQYGVPFYPEHMPPAIKAAFVEGTVQEHKLKDDTVVKIVFEDDKPKRVASVS